MKIIISPAKKMEVCDDLMQAGQMPQLLEETECLLECMQGMDYGQLKALWKCNDKIAELNYERIQNMDLHGRCSPALLSYEGIQYQYMAPQVFTDVQWGYVRQNLRILSGFYGILRPEDGVVPYRLEMQARLAVKGEKDLYGFWKGKISEKLLEDGAEPVLNLASKEYSRAVEPYLPPHVPFITCIFGEYSEGKVKMKGTQAKMARGEMVRWIAENQIQDWKDITEFDGLGYHFDGELSGGTELVFCRS